MSRVFRTALPITLALVACASMTYRAAAETASSASTAKAAPAKPALAHANFAGGCFWSMEKAFEDVPGIKSVVSGYSGGSVPNPSYELVSSGTTGHRETVRIEYDPALISYDKLLDIYWHNTDPTDPEGQFCDHADEYRPAIFVADDGQRAAAEKSRRVLGASGVLKRPIVTEILPAVVFYPAESYHQDFFKKSAAHYEAYRISCGRDRVMASMWGKDAHRGSVHK